MKDERQRWFLTWVIFCALAATASAADFGSSAHEVFDLNPGSVGSFPSNMTVFGNALYFSAYTFSMGRELWRYDGSSIVLVTNINETADDIGFGNLEGNDSVPDWLTDFRSTLYFSAFDPRRGGELWRYNGTNAVRVADINPDFNDTIKILQNSSWPNQLTVFNNTLYFSADTGAERPDYELWKYDGSSVSLVANIHPNIGSNFSSYPHGFTAYNGALYFSADDGTHGYELWKHTDTTTTLLSDIHSGRGDSFPKNFTVFDGALYFQAYTDTEGFELWKTDGSSVSRVTDLNPGPASSQPEFLTVFNGSLYFRATDGLNGHELWKFDGTSATLVSNINAFADSFPKNLKVFNNQLCFAADDGIHGWELWTCNGTTVSLTTNLNTSGDSFPEWLTIVNNKLYFVATTPETGYEIWKYDGTNVTLAADIYPGPGSSYPQFLTRFNDELCFRATDDGGFSNWELWSLLDMPFRITRLEFQGSSTRIDWTTSAGTTNILQASDGVAGPFVDISGPIQIQGSGEVTTNYLDRIPAESHSRFYRVVQP